MYKLHSLLPQRDSTKCWTGTGELGPGRCAPPFFTTIFFRPGQALGNQVVVVGLLSSIADLCKTERPWGARPGKMHYLFHGQPPCQDWTGPEESGMGLFAPFFHDCKARQAL